MKVLVIGASGHVGSYLTAELVKENFEVYAIMRGERTPYGYDENIWSKVNVIKMSREELNKSDLIERGNFDVICDLIAFDIENVKKLVAKIKNDAFYLQIGSIWMYGNKEYIPVDELHPKNGFGEYGIQKGVIEDYLLDLARKNQLRTSVVHPGHVSAKEWTPINPQGNVDKSVFKKLKNGEQIALPFLGLTTLQHIHSYDLARIIIACIKNQKVANGQAFNAVCEKAMTLRSLCEYCFKRYNKKPNIKYVEWDEFEQIVGKENALDTLDHATHSPCCSMEKTISLLGVKLKYSITDIFDEYLDYADYL